MPNKGLDLTATKKSKEEKPRERQWEKRINRIKYLMEKYGHKWRNKVQKGQSPLR